MAKLDTYFEKCLFFSTNSLARNINRISEIEFNSIGLSSSYVFILMIVKEESDISTGKIAQTMNMDSSTITRFIEKLVFQGFIEKKSEGRSTKISLTQKGEDIQDDIHAAWKRVYEKYKSVLGDELTESLTKNTAQANTALSKKD